MRLQFCALFALDFMGHSNCLISPSLRVIQTHKFSFLSLSPATSYCLTKRRSIYGKESIVTQSARYQAVTTKYVVRSSNSFTNHSESPFSGLENVMMGYVFGQKKLTEVAHAVWKKIVRKGDVVIDATCGNGYDTLAMLRLIADDTRRGRVYAMDLQKDALENTSCLLDHSVTADERKLVELYSMCHTKMEDIVQVADSVRLVAFNLGYLPGGDKRVKTESETTLHALETAGRVVAHGGLISVVSYLGHSGGREEFDAVESFAAGLSMDSWVCCKLQMMNRPLAPVLVLLYRK